jgi:hypothetical protein
MSAQSSRITAGTHQLLGESARLTVRSATRVSPVDQSAIRWQSARVSAVLTSTIVRTYGRYLISVSILNIGKYMATTIRPTIAPTPIIMIGSMIEVSAWIDASTSSS